MPTSCMTDEMEMVAEALTYSPSLLHMLAMSDLQNTAPRLPRCSKLPRSSNMFSHAYTSFSQHLFCKLCKAPAVLGCCRVGFTVPHPDTWASAAARRRQLTGQERLSHVCNTGTGTLHKHLRRFWLQHAAELQVLGHTAVELEAWLSLIPSSQLLQAACQKRQTASRCLDGSACHFDLSPQSLDHPRLPWLTTCNLFCPPCQQIC